MYLTEGPGPWQAFLKRPDNIGLSIIEAKQKYLQEQLLFEQQISYLQLWNSLSPTAPGAGPGGGGRKKETPATTPAEELLTENNEVLLTEDGFDLTTE